MGLAPHLTQASPPTYRFRLYDLEAGDFLDRLKMVRESRSLYGVNPFTSPAKAVELVKPLLITADREMVLVMSLTAKMEALAVEIVAVDGLDVCCFDMCNIFKHSLLNNAACILCFHNHPSGDPIPSKEDIQISRRMKEAGEILGIRLVDQWRVLVKDSYRPLDW